MLQDEPLEHTAAPQGSREVQAPEESRAAVQQVRIGGC